MFSCDLGSFFFLLLLSRNNLFFFTNGPVVSTFMTGSNIFKTFQAFGSILSTFENKFYKLLANETLAYAFDLRWMPVQNAL